MDNPGLFHEIPDISSLLPDGGVDGEEACLADRVIADWTLWPNLHWMTTCTGRNALSAVLPVGSVPRQPPPLASANFIVAEQGSIPSISRQVNNAFITFRSFRKVRTVLAHGVRRPG